ncbi:hypothetical protein [Algiphilus sp.]|uniref:hypothetical protein n=1 Tax=Algiphilus sp. TaxID=1872431 RepID=UPI0025C56BC1|nr:hypothetical protein [Algiphilus sp.]MCK5771167.1 hypothetical protein [Algiphilus sp.]
MALTLKLDYSDHEITGIETEDNPVVSVDYHGNVLSRLTDDVWLFPSDKSRPRLRVTVNWPDNSHDAKRLALLRLTHGKTLAALTAFRTCWHLARLAAHCADQRVRLKDLHRHPNVVIDFVATPKPGQSKPHNHKMRAIVSIARVALAARDTLGWTFLEHDQIRALRNIDTLSHRQHAVIPRRIYQVVDDTAQEILSDYLTVADELAEVLAAWAHATCDQRRPGGKVHWATLMSDRPRLRRQMDRVGNVSTPLASYFALVRTAAFWTLIAGTCARKSEILALRRGCLRQEQIGDNLTHLLTGPTTKTQDNPHAIWVASPKVAPAAQALERLLDTYITVHPNPPHLSDHLFQVLEMDFGRRRAPSEKRKGKLQFGQPISNAGLTRIAQHADLGITQEDWAEAKQLTPDLDETKYAVGRQWPVSAHQIRRTVLVNAAASGLVSPDSLSFQAKHQTWQMTAYYCRNYWHLAASHPDHPLVTGTRRANAEEFTRIYADAYNQARSRIIDDERFFSPYGDDHKRSVVGDTPLLSLDEIKRLTRSGTLKRNTLGLCALVDDDCEWQSALTVRGCMTKAEGKPCSKAIIDSHRLPELTALRDSVRYGLEELSARDAFAREQKKADLAMVEQAIALIESHRDAQREPQ